jgi:hypothetical protein
MMNDLGPLLRSFETASDRQIDAAIAKRLAATADQPSVGGLLQIMDECAYASLASDFCMHAMHVIWRMLLTRYRHFAEDTSNSFKEVVLLGGPPSRLDETCQWVGENSSALWTMDLVSGDERFQFRFQAVNDAVHFKLRWYK